MKDIAKPYPRIGWGAMFYKWLFDRSVPYNSYGNGAVMRINLVVWVASVGLVLQSVCEKLKGILKEKSKFLSCDKWCEIGQKMSYTDEKKLRYNEVTKTQRRAT